MNSTAAAEQWKRNCTRRGQAYRAGLTAGTAAAEGGRDTYDPAAAGDPRYAASYRTGWMHGWLRITRRQEAAARQENPR